MSDTEEQQQMERLHYEEGEQKLSEVMLEEDLDNSPHHEVEDDDYGIDSYTSKEYSGYNRSVLHDSDYDRYENKSSYKRYETSEEVTEEKEEFYSKHSYGDETLELPRTDDDQNENNILKSPEMEALPPRDAKEQFLSSHYVDRNGDDEKQPSREDLMESNGNDENGQHYESSKEQNENVENISRSDEGLRKKTDGIGGDISSKLDKFNRTIENTNAPAIRSKIEDNELPTKGKVSSLKSLFESNAVHNSDTGKNASYKHEYGVGKSTGVVNKSVFH